MIDHEMMNQITKKTHHHLGRLNNTTRRRQTKSQNLTNKQELSRNMKNEMSQEYLQSKQVQKLEYINASLQNSAHQNTESTMKTNLK
jgi:hypothetical protein